MTTESSDSVTERRDLLIVLLSRAERGVLSERERPLLRPLVQAEMATLDRLDAAENADFTAEHALHEEHRRSIALVLDLPADADWLAVTRRITEIRRRTDKRREQLARALGAAEDAPWLDLIVAAVKARTGQKPTTPTDGPQR